MMIVMTIMIIDRTHIKLNTIEFLFFPFIIIIIIHTAMMYNNNNNDDHHHHQCISQNKCVCYVWNKKKVDIYEKVIRYENDYIVFLRCVFVWCCVGEKAFKFNLSF